MSSRLNPYLSFKNTAREAMEFYKSIFGGELTVSTFGEGGMSENPAEKDKVMHSMLIGSNGFALMGSDTPNRMEFKPGNTVTISLSGEDDAELRGYWNKLADGAKITMPLEKAPWGDSFGQLTDKFGTVDGQYRRAARLELPPTGAGLRRGPALFVGDFCALASPLPIPCARVAPRAGVPNWHLIHNGLPSTGGRRTCGPGGSQVTARRPSQLHPTRAWARSLAPTTQRYSAS
jgi:PhnB protein